MSLTVVFLILVIGMAIGIGLSRPIAIIKAYWRSYTFKPVLLRPYLPERESTADDRQGD